MYFRQRWESSNCELREDSSLSCENVQFSLTQVTCSTDLGTDSRLGPQKWVSNLKNPSQQVWSHLITLLQPFCVMQQTSRSDLEGFTQVSLAMAGSSCHSLGEDISSHFELSLFYVISRGGVLPGQMSQLWHNCPLKLGRMQWSHVPMESYRGLEKPHADYPALGTLPTGEGCSLMITRNGRCWGNSQSCRFKH